MDELQLMRDCLPGQPPPDPDVVAGARDRLAHGRPRRPAGRQLWSLPLAGMRPARRARLLRAGLPTAVAAAAAAAAVTVTAMIPAAAPRPAPTPITGGIPGAGYLPYTGAVPTARAGRGNGARAVLLAAARTVGQAAPSAPERYWVTSGTVGNFVQLGPASDRYMVLEEAAVQNWTARSPQVSSPLMAQALGAAPVSAADRAAWRRDGSPRKWTYAGGQTDTLANPQGYASGFVFPLTTTGAPLMTMGAGSGSPPFQVGAKELTLAQLRALPADPAKLKKLILTGGVAPGETASDYFLQTVPPIMEMPVTPAVRAALYRMLAGMPGMDSLGRVTDPEGQQGEAISYTGTYKNCEPNTTIGPGRQTMFSSCTTQQILIINATTGMPAAEELRYVGLPPGQHWPAPDGLFSYEIFGQSYGTNQNPPLGANPPENSQPPITQRPEACYSYLDQHTHRIVKMCAPDRIMGSIGGTSVAK